MTLDGLDPSLSQPKRLATMGIVSAARRVDFSFIRDQLNLSDSDLSKQLKALSDAGYIETTKTGRGPTRKTWVLITEQGADALDAHAHALQRLINPEPAPEPSADAGAPPPPRPTPAPPLRPITGPAAG